MIIGGARGFTTTAGGSWGCDGGKDPRVGSMRLEVRGWGEQRAGIIKGFGRRGSLNRKRIERRRRSRRGDGRIGSSSFPVCVCGGGVFT